jgi:predicted nucleotide-binding protein
MQLTERHAKIRAIAEFLSSLSEAEVDAILQSAGALGITSGGFDILSGEDKQAQISTLLWRQSDEVVERLPTERRPEIWAIAEFFSSLSQAEAAGILQSAGASGVTSSDFGSLSEEGKRAQISVLLWRESGQVVKMLLEFVPAVEELPIAAPAPSELSPSVLQVSESTRTSDGPIFIVHGHARGMLHEAVRVLERGTGRDVIVLHEQANAGRTILEKFEDYAGHVSFAVVLLTGDDQGGMRSSDDVQLRGRQNVIFELGFFFGKLGRTRVAVLLESNVEKPSDIDGLVYITLDQSGAWKYALARELEASGISIDRSRIP